MLPMMRSQQTHSVKARVHYELIVELIKNHTPYNRRVDASNVVVDANTDVLVAGGGIIGLSTALALAESGLRVTVLDQATSMREASWAAAGMLAAGDPENPTALGELAALSLSLYPEYLRRIERLSGRTVSLRTSGTLQGTCIGRRFDSHYQSGRAVSSTELGELVPHLVTSGREFRVLEEASLDPRNLCATLPLAAKVAGVTVAEYTSVLTAFTLPNGRVAIKTSRGTISADAFVNCAGAWAADIGSSNDSSHGGEGTASSDTTSLPIKPLKGQIVTVRIDARDSPRHVIRTPEIYLVPRGDGLILIGATVEDVGFDKTIDSAAIRSLIDRAATLWPPLASATVIESWAGLRPGSPDGLPIIGPLCGPDLEDTEASRCWVATGHFRNGILLAPATARILSQLVRGLATDINVKPFSVSRFVPALTSK
jgi:glycine oxidase